MSCADTERIVRNWNRIHRETARALKATPDSKLDFQPKEGMFTLRQLITHIPEAELALARAALAGSTQRVRFDTEGLSVAQIVEAFDRQHEELAEEVSKLTLDQLNEEIEFHGRRMRRKVLLYAITEHEIHHRGQLFTYLRLVDVEPPDIHAD